MCGKTLFNILSLFAFQKALKMVQKNSPGNTLRDIIETRTQLATERDVKNDPLLRKAIDRLSQEGDWLLGKGRHNWVRSCAQSLNDPNNWEGYSMSVHMTYALEQRGKECRGEVQLISGDKSDVDIVYDDKNGIQIRIECVATMEPLTYWQTEEVDELFPALTIKTARYDAEGEAGLAHRVQFKTRIKTIKYKSVDGQTVYLEPTKFPVADNDSLNIIAVDVTQGTGTPPDWYDLELWSNGNGLQLFKKMDVLGLFEAPNLFAPEFDREYNGNRYLRERVHGILFLIDRSNWRSPLNPMYDARLVNNPRIQFTDGQQQAWNELGNSLSGFVKNWILKPQIRG